MTLFQSLQKTSDWETKYQILIEAGVKLPEFAESKRIPNNRVAGCTAVTWIITEYNQDKLQIQGYSKSHIVQGLIALLIESYSGLTKEEVHERDITYFSPLHINDLITATRVNGFTTMISKILNTL